jgi:hypothetical protein
MWGLFDITLAIGCYVAGGASVWFYKSWMQKAVVTVNAGVVTAKADAAKVASTASTIVNEVKKL